MLKRKPLRRNPDNCTAFTDELRRLRLPGFAGQACLHRIEAVTAPLIKVKPVPPPNRFRIADAGFCWLTLLPDEGNFAVTGILNESGEVYQVYVDLILDKGEDWFLDALIDVILFDDGRVFVDDLDELERARAGGEITDEQAASLLALARRIEHSMKAEPGRWTNLIRLAAEAFRAGQ